jgi:NAD(P)H-hydrate epimerase
MLLLSVERMKELEKQADAQGYAYAEMMKSAGSALARIIEDRWKSAPKKSIIGLVGGGNNGADTLIALAALHQIGWQTTAVLLDPGEQLDWVMSDVKSAGFEVLVFDQDRKRVGEAVKESTLVLDGILGTGYKPPMREDLAEKMKFLVDHSRGKTIIAVDCPSGVDCSTGSVSPGTMQATLTVCMEAVKVGLVKFPAFDYVGELVIADVGIVKKLHTKTDKGDFVIDDSLTRKTMPDRKKESHKGSFGTVLVCGGSVNYPGAPVLSARSAYQIGAGLVRTAIPERIYDAIVGNCLESTWVILDDENGVIAESAIRILTKEFPRVDCLVLGPGIGREDTTLRFLHGLLDTSRDQKTPKKMGLIPSGAAILSGSINKLPLVVIDADGLTLLAKIKDWPGMLEGKDVILTPHPGEMSALTGLSIEEVQNDRMEIARKFAHEWHQCVVLKGALTVVASPDGQVAVCPVATSALAKAGSGDVLTGLIAGLIAQGAGLFEAATAGVWIHANAGLLASLMVGSERCVVLDDLLAAIPEVVQELK